MSEKIQPIDDGRIERGHITECACCGCRGVFCDTDAGGIVDSDGRERYVELAQEDGPDLEALLVGTTNGTRCDEVFCYECAEECA